MAGFYKTLVNMIVIVSLLLALCVCVDYAANETTVSNMDQVNDSVKLNDTNVINGTYYVGVDNGTKVTALKKVVIVKPKIPLVTITAKPSVRSKYAYKWYTRTWVNYCPNCKHYNVLLINPKGVPERELTCKRCSSDFCGVTGKEKYSWSHVYLRKP